MAFKQAYSLSSIWSSWKGSTSSSRILTDTLPTSNSGQFLGMMWSFPAGETHFGETLKNARLELVHGRGRTFFSITGLGGAYWQHERGCKHVHVSALPNKRISLYSMDLFAAPSRRCSPAWARSSATWNTMRWFTCWWWPFPKSLFCHLKLSKKEHEKKKKPVGRHGARSLIQHQQISYQGLVMTLLMIGNFFFGGGI